MGTLILFIPNIISVMKFAMQFSSEPRARGGRRPAANCRGGAEGENTETVQLLVVVIMFCEEYDHIFGDAVWRQRVVRRAQVWKPKREPKQSNCLQIK